MIRAVLGGSFDPVHNGHCSMVRRVLFDHLADEVLIIPAWCSPLKTGSFASAENRLEMAHLAFADQVGVRIDSREVNQHASVYTVDTLTVLTREYPDDILRLVVGADNLQDFASWHKPETILNLAELIVLARSGSELPENLFADDLVKKKIILIKDFDEPVSSTEIRARLANGDLPAEKLPEQVTRYITTHKLYNLENN